MGYDPDPNQICPDCLGPPHKTMAQPKPKAPDSIEITREEFMKAWEGAGSPNEFGVIETTIHELADKLFGPQENK